MSSTNGDRPDRTRPFKMPWTRHETELLGEIARLATVARMAAQTEIDVPTPNGQSTRPIGSEDLIFNALLMRAMRQPER